MSSQCSDLEKYLFIVRQILDHEATPEDEKYLLDHLEQCSCCLREYELEQQVRTLLKKKLEKQPLPEGLASSIKSKILQSSKNVK